MKTSAAEPRLLPEEQFAKDVEYYLQLEPRQLPSRYLYDELGSALFDAICRLPWYRVTRAERAMLAAIGPEILAQAGRLERIVELGPGNGEKLATLLSGVAPARSGSQTPKRPASSTDTLTLHLVDVSPAALATASLTVGAIPNVRVVAHEASYEAGLADAMHSARGEGQRLVLFLGSNIGNFDPPGRDAFLHSIRSTLQRGDLFLMGADLVKPQGELMLAYDDPLGVTAAFNLNLLCRLNRELGADFDLARFKHQAVWNAAESRVEMHLVSLRRQPVTIRDVKLAFTLEEGESIWTESSYKFERRQVLDTLTRAGFAGVRQWVDEEAKFALTLVRAV